jgi:transcriptional regulator with XRE-family HTH domain
MATTTINGAAMRIIRERSELTVRGLVQRIAETGINVHPDHIRNIELGNKQPSPRLLAAIAQALAVPKHALYGVPGEPVGARG